MDWMTDLPRLAREAMPEPYGVLDSFPPSYYFSADQMHAHALKVAALALEEAAKTVNLHAAALDASNAWGLRDSDGEELRVVAAAIRSLITK